MRPYTTLFAASALMAGSALARPDGTGAHHHHSEHSAVSAPSAGGSASGYGAPQSGYGAPDAGYGAPEQSYAQPDAGYGAPDPGYGAPSEGYADYSSGTGYVEPQDSYGVAASGDSGLSAILIPLLIAAALFLLIPGTRTVDVNQRRKRSAGKLHRATSCPASDWPICAICEPLIGQIMLRATRIPLTTIQTLIHTCKYLHNMIRFYNSLIAMTNIWQTVDVS